MEIPSTTIRDNNGKILIYSINDFYNSIVIKKDCFICGVKYNKIHFNDEHILPNWLLKYLNLSEKKIILPNKANYKYSRYKIPCCINCNSDLSTILEIPVSKLLKNSFSDFITIINEDNKLVYILFRWLMLIYFKSHLKDTNFNWHLNKSIGQEKISDVYDWKNLHHMHCMVRSHYTNAILHENTFGSIFILPSLIYPNYEQFDFIDNTKGNSILIRIKEICLIAVLNDSCATLNLYNNNMLKINRYLTPLQLREIFTHITYISMNLKETPKYFSKFSQNGKYEIEGIMPDIFELVDENKRGVSQGELLHHYVEQLISNVDNSETILNEIKNDRYSFLFDQNGNFIQV